MSYLYIIARRHRDISQLERLGWEIVGKDPRYGSVWLRKEVAR